MPGSAAALRRVIAEIQSGEVKYELMTTQFADLTRQQLPQLKGLLSGLGAVQRLFEASGRAARIITKWCSSGGRGCIPSR